MVLSKFKTRLACYVVWSLFICIPILAQPADEQASRFLQPGHTRDLLFVGWSPDGKLIASYSGADGRIKVWNANTGQLLWDIKNLLLKPDVPLKNPDGSLLASGVKGESFQIREAQSGKTIWTIKDGSTSPERVPSPDGSMIAERGRYGDACVKIFEARSNKLIRRLEGHPGIVHAIAFSPDGKLIASAGGDKLIRFWDAQTGAVTKILAKHTGKIVSLAFSGDGQRLISNSEDGTVQIWNVNDGSLLTNELHKEDWVSEVRYVAFSPKGNLIVSAHEDSTIKVWDGTRGRLLRVIKGRFEDLRVAVFSPDASLIATGYDSSDSRVELWSVRSGRLVARLGKDSDYVHSLAFSQDGSMIVTGHLADDIKVWSTRSRKLLKNFKQPYYSSDDQVAFSPDGKHVVSGGENQNILLWNVKSGSLVWSAIPIDWETERRWHEEAAKYFAKQSALEAEREQRTVAADKEVSKWVRPVTITLDHFGEATNPLTQRMMETGKVEKSLVTKSAADADGVWLRLRNNSPLPISFRTVSGYLSLGDGAEVSIQYEIEEANGKSVPWGIDVSWISVLPPGASVLFSVSKAHLENRRTIFVSYTFRKKNDEYGTARRVSFRLRKRR